MKLSIIIPCYKVEQYLDQCLESVTRNKTEEIEIILVDDGSPDRVPQMCDEWAEKDKRVKVIHQKNGGLSVARNVGLDVSIGEYIWFIDSDDWITDDAICRVLKYIKKYPDINVFVSPILWTWEDSRKNYSDIVVDIDTRMTGDEYISSFPTARGASSRNIIKREYIESLNLHFQSGIVHEDDLYGLVLYSNIREVYVLKNYIYCYRQREGSIMHSINIKSAYSIITIHKEFLKHIEKTHPAEEHLKYHLRYKWYFAWAMLSTWSLHNNSEFKKFLSDTKEYRIKECTLLSSNPSKKEKFHSWLLAYHPITYVYYTHGYKLLKKYLRQQAIEVCSKLKLYDMVYNFYKRK